MSFPYMPMFWGDYLRDTYHLTTLEHGAYLLLIGSYWSSGEPLPDDDRRLARLTKLSVEEWKEMRCELVGFFDVEDGLWRQPRIDRELAKASARHEQSKEAARRSAEVRAGRHNKRPLSDRSTGVEPTISKSKPKEEPDANASGTGASAPFVLPDWMPKEEWSAFLEMRKRIRKVPTPHALKLLVGELEKLKAQGHTPAAVLDQSTVNSWAGVFAIKGDRGGKPKTGVHRRTFDEPGYYDNDKTGVL